jgi:hypothetical protein
MTSQETSLLIGAIIGLMGAVQAWLVSRSVTHGKQLNGLMTPRITEGAEKAIAQDHVDRSEAASPVSDALIQARRAALTAELAALDASAAVRTPNNARLLPPRT